MTRRELFVGLFGALLAPVVAKLFPKEPLPRAGYEVLAGTAVRYEWGWHLIDKPNPGHEIKYLD